jgi:hypothetical protein
MTQAEAESPLRQKHLDYVQQVIGRMAGNSFLVKGWSVTILIAVLGFAKEGLDWRFGALAAASVSMFWWLDGFFLRQENLFRILYDRVRLTDQSRLVALPYSMDTHYDRGATNYPTPGHILPPKPGSVARVMFGPTLRWFHGVLLLLAIGGTLFLAYTAAKPKPVLKCASVNATQRLSDAERC